MKNPHLDFEDLKLRLNYDIGNIRQLLSMIDEYLQSLPGEVQSVTNSKDLAALKKQGHRLKGLASSASMYTLSELGKNLQNMNTWDESTIQSVVHAILEESEKLRMTLRKALEELH